MAKKTFSPAEAWQTLLEEEQLLKRTVPRLKVMEPVICTLFTLLHVVCSVVTFYPFLIATYINDPTQTVKELPFLYGIAQKILTVANNTQDLTAAIWVAGIPGVFLICLVVALVMRLFFITVPEKPEPLSANYLTALKQVIQKANQIEALSRDEPRLMLRAFLGLMVMVLAVVVLIFAAFSPSDPDFLATVIASLFMMIPYCGFSMLSFALLKVIALRQEPDYLAYERLLKDAKEALKEEEERISEEAEEKARLEKIDNAAKAFLSGDFDAANALLKDVPAKNSGDILAIQTLSDSLLGKDKNGSRKAFKYLWDAKDLGFRNAGIRSAVDAALEQIKPLMLEQCQSELFEAYAAFLQKNYYEAGRKAKKLADYGHPDAIMVMLVSLTESKNDPNKYPEWLELAKKAKRRGFDPLYEEIFDELIAQLEIAIRKNEVYKEIRENRPSSYYNPSHYSGTFTTYTPTMEASGWYDFRTGETLYRVNGQIVNGNGEEVSPAWWC